ncbi:MAG: hypothetical protein PHY12_06540 [Eubacteriales bacterium]|nr:hypothetical protein [Eubacteriales bacterium]
MKKARMGRAAAIGLLLALLALGGAAAESAPSYPDKLTVGTASQTTNAESTPAPESGAADALPTRAPGPLRAEMDGWSGVYDGESHGVSGWRVYDAAGQPLAGADFRFTFGLSRETATAPSAPLRRDAGRTTVYVRAELTATGETAFGSAEIEIAPRGVTVAPWSGEEGFAGGVLETEYDGAPHGFDSFRVSGLMGRDAVQSVTLPQSAMQTAPCERAAVTPSGAVFAPGVNADNYAVRYETAYLTLWPTRKPLRVTVSCTDAVYDGGARGFSLSCDAPAGVPVRWWLMDKSGFWTETAPDSLRVYASDAGTYSISVKASSPYYAAESDPVSARFTIARRPLLLRARSASFVFDGRSRSVAAADGSLFEALPLEGAGGLVPGDEVSAEVRGDGRVNAGSWTVAIAPDTVRVGERTGNYAITLQSGRLLISPLPGSPEAAVVGERAVYDGAAHGFTLYPRVVGDYQLLCRLPGADAFEPVDALPAYRDAGVYPVEVYIHSDNYAQPDSAVTGGDVVVSPLTVTLTAGSLWDAVYGVDAQGAPIERRVSKAGSTQVPAALPGGDTLLYMLTDAIAEEDRQYQGDFVAFTQPGAHPVHIVGAQLRDPSRAANYRIVTVDGAVVIRPAEDAPSLTLTDGGHVYDGTEHVSQNGFCILASGKDVTEQYRLVSRVIFTPAGGGAPETRLYTDGEKPGFREAGAYRVTVNAQSDTLPSVSATAEYVVSRAPLCVTGGVGSKPYDGLPLTVAAADAVIGLADGHTLDLSGARFAPGCENSRAAYGRGAVLLEGGLTVRDAAGADVTANYELRFLPGWVEITRQEAAQLAWADAEMVYDGAPHALPQPTVRLGAQDVTAEYDFTYALEGGEFAAEPPLFTDACERAAVRVRGKSRNPGLCDVEGAAAIRVTRRPLTVACGRGEYAFDGTEKTVPLWDAARTTGLVPGQTLDLSRAAFARGPSAALQPLRLSLGGNDVLLRAGARVWDGETETTANYAVSYAPGRIDIVPTPRALRVSVTGGEAVYDGEPHPFACTVDAGGLPGTRVLYSTDGRNFAARQPDPPVNAGTHTLYVRAVNLRFTQSEVTACAAWIIRPRAVVLRGLSADIPFDGQPHAVPEPGYEIASGALAAHESLNAEVSAEPLTGPGEAAVLPRVVSVRKSRMENYAFIVLPGRLRVTLGAT